MKTLLLSLVLVFTTQNLTAQNNSVVQFEMGVGMTNSSLSQSNYAQAVNLNGTLKYQIRSFTLGLRYEHTISTIGIEGPTVDKIFKDTIIGREGEFSNYKSIQLRIDYSPNFEHFKPVFGIGYSLIFLRNSVQYYDHDFKKVETPPYHEDPEKRIFNSLVYYIGYKVKNIQYGLTLLPDTGENLKRIVGTSISYSFGLTKKKSPPKHEYSLNHNWKSKPLFFRLEVGRSLVVPLQNYYAASPRYYISSQIRIFNNLYIGLTNEEEGERMGYDKNTIGIFHQNSWGYSVTKTQVSRKISAQKVFVHKFRPIAKNVDFYYGGGIGIYRINSVKVLRYESLLSYPNIIEKSKNWGLLLSTGLRTGWFNNRLEINIPFGNIPIYAGLQTAIGIQFRRRMRSKKSN